MGKLLGATLCLVLTASCSLQRAAKPSVTPHSGSHHKSQALEDIIKAADPNVNIGVSIRSLSSNRIVFEKNSARHFVPCSTIKLITLAAALHYLGPSYRYTTKVFMAGATKKNDVIGDLYIQGSGDPSLMDTDILRLAQEIAQRGIRKISGNIYIDDQIFDDVLWGRGDMWDDRYKGYAAPVSGLNLNYNRLLIKTVPAFKRGGIARPIVQPSSRYIEVASEAKTLDGATSLSLALMRGKHRETDWPSETRDGLRMGDKVVVNGKIGKGAQPHYATFAVNDPGIFTGVVLKEELERNGIKIKGSVKRKAVPAKATLVASHQSRSLAEALIDFTKISNNVANDALVKTIAAEGGMRPASATAGLNRIAEILAKEVGLPMGSLVAADGAGLSRYSLITPAQMVKLLDYSANHFHMGPEFMSALSFGGEDGLLKSRLTMDKVRGQIRAKSGTMSGLSNLAGFFTDEKGERYAFAIMINGFVGSSAPYVSLQDQILAAMLVDDQTPMAKVK